MIIDKEKVFKTGFVFFTIAIACSFSLIGVFESLSLNEFPDLGKKINADERVSPLEIPFDIMEKRIAIPIPNIEKEIALSLDPPRPDAINEKKGSFLIRLKKSNQTLATILPARIHLQYDKELCFSSSSSPFWVELEHSGSNRVFVHVFVVDLDGQNQKVAGFQVLAESAPIRHPQDFEEGSPIRILSEARLLGKDPVLVKYGGGTTLGRLEFGESKEIWNVKEGDFLCWKEGRWKKIDSLLEDSEKFIARVCFLNEKMIELEVWGLDQYSRVCISCSQPPPFKTKAEEILSSVRIRSEKQISCMLEKQCFVLKTGDFVLKSDNKWKVLRKQEEKDAYLKGELEGDLFVFDKIDQKGGQKILQGALFDQARLQMVPIEYVAATQKKGGKGKAK